jgi:hypothetical protein
MKLGFIAGFGAGYVLGSKAGRERYEQLQKLYGNLIQTPQAEQARQNVRELATRGREKVSQRRSSAESDDTTSSNHSS